MTANSLPSTEQATLPGWHATTRPIGLVCKLTKPLSYLVLSCVVLSGLVRGMNDLIWVLSAPVHAKEVAARVAWERRGDDATTAALLRATGAAEDVWDEDDEEVTCCG